MVRFATPGSERGIGCTLAIDDIDGFGRQYDGEYLLSVEDFSHDGARCHTSAIMMPGVKHTHNSSLAQYALAQEFLG